MATIAPQTSLVSRRKIHSLKMDMTPLVDLGFLLITFFIFTTALSQPSILHLVMPTKGSTSPVAQSHALTILLDKEKAYAYEGLWEEAVLQNRMVETRYDLQKGIGHLIRQKQKNMAQQDDLVVLIKPLTSTTYERVLTALDEMQINQVKKYAILDASAEEISFVQK